LIFYFYLLQSILSLSFLRSYLYLLSLATFLTADPARLKWPRLFD